MLDWSIWNRQTPRSNENPKDPFGFGVNLKSKSPNDLMQHSIIEFDPIEVASSKF